MKTYAFKDVKAYPASQLMISDWSVCVPVTYKKIWDDGFGARGWKLDATINDPVIIASTRETGRRIKTSVFVHDILDHLLSGFGMSGHRSEAMALMQLFLRTGSDPHPDYQQMVNEDILQGHVNGEDFLSFLPRSLRSMVPVGVTWSDREIISFLKEQIGRTRLSDLLVNRFFELGEEGQDHARDSWGKLGLEPSRRAGIGMALQKLLEAIDIAAEKEVLDDLRGLFRISNDKCAFEVLSSDGSKIKKCMKLKSPNNVYELLPQGQRIMAV